MASSVAVLGSGILGSSTALFLARGGARVAVFDAAEAPFSRTSRWNEGKIHLGYLYSADTSLRSARGLIPGGLAFKRLTEELIGCPIDDLATPQDDTYLVHRDSVVPADEFAAYVERVADLVVSHPDAPDYFVDLTKVRPRTLERDEIAADFESEIVVAGVRVPERSVSTVPVSERFVDALRAEARIQLVMGTRVTAVRLGGPSPSGPLLVETERGVEGPFDLVINALWEGRPAIDAGFGILPCAAWTHRYRVSLFATTQDAVSIPSFVLVVGPFGDVKAYGPRDVYVSWYPTGLLIEGSRLAPPDVPALSEPARAAIVEATLDGITRAIPSLGALRDARPEIRLEGGWVYAIGEGSLADRHATLHRRDRIQVVREGSYISIDTGKYSIAPWLARRVADELLGR